MNGARTQLQAAARLRAVLAFPCAVLRAMSRDRTALFFSLLLPVALIVVIGVAFGGSGRLDIGWVDLDRSAASRTIIDRIDGHPAVNATEFTSAEALHDALQRREIVAAFVIPAGAQTALDRGDPVNLDLAAPPGDSQGMAALAAISAAASPVNTRIAVTRAVLNISNLDHDTASAAIETVRGQGTDLVDVDVIDVGADQSSINQFSLTASQNLVLFVFVTAMVSASFVVAARRHGVLYRSLSTPASVTDILGGLCVAILAVTFVQSITILVIGAAVFNVDWGNPAAAGALVVATNLAAAAAGVCIGAFGRNPDRTAALAPILGIALAIIGGCILPLELFPASLRAVAHGVPQYWAVSAWQQLIFDGAHTANIAASLAVLLTSAAALFALAIASFTRELRHVRA